MDVPMADLELTRERFPYYAIRGRHIRNSELLAAKETVRGYVWIHAPLDWLFGGDDPGAVESYGIKVRDRLSGGTAEGAIPLMRWRVRGPVGHALDVHDA